MRCLVGSSSHWRFWPIFGGKHLMKMSQTIHMVRSIKMTCNSSLDTDSQASRSAQRYGDLMRRICLLALIVLAFCRPAFSQEIAEFKSIDSFLQSLDGAKLKIFAEGDLFNKARMDWAGIVSSKAKNGEEISEI